MGKKPMLKWTSLVLAGLTLCGCQNSSPRQIGAGGMAQKGTGQNGSLAKQNPAQQTPGMLDQNPYGRAPQDPYGRPLQDPYGRPQGGLGSQQQLQPGMNGYGSQTIHNPNPGIAPPPNTGQFGSPGTLNLPAPNTPRLNSMSPHSPTQPELGHMSPESGYNTRLSHQDVAPPPADPSLHRFGPPDTNPGVIVIPAQPTSPGYGIPPPSIPQQPRIGN